MYHTIPLAVFIEAYYNQWWIKRVMRKGEAIMTAVFPVSMTALWLGAMIALLIAPGENYGTDESYTAVRVSAVRATAKDDIAREQSCPFGTHYFKKPGEVSPDGFEHQAFPDLVYVDGTAYVISREAHSHYVQTSDPDEYVPAGRILRNCSLVVR
jgi:hypothetical protein